MRTEDTSSDVTALLRERTGYVLRGLSDRVAQVDAELKRLGYAVAADALPDEIETASVAPVERAVQPKRRGR